MLQQRKPNWADKLNALLVPYIGPPPLGPYGEPPLPPTQESGCPMCGIAMADPLTPDPSTGETARRAERASAAGRVALKPSC